MVNWQGGEGCWKEALPTWNTTMAQPKGQIERLHRVPSRPQDIKEAGWGGINSIGVEGSG